MFNGFEEAFCYSIIPTVSLSTHTLSYFPMIFKNTCKSKSIINSGLYMGYVKYLKKFLQDSICDKCKDDQVVINKNCIKYDYISIDENQDIFLNIDKKQLEKYENIKQETNNDSPIFIQTPGDINFNRIYRGIFEYCQFFIIYVIILLTIINYILLYSKQNLLFIIINICFFIYLMNIDISCILN